MKTEKYASTHRAEKHGFETYAEAKKWADDRISEYLELSKEPKSVSVLILKDLGMSFFNVLTGKSSTSATYNVDLKIEFEADVE